MLQIANTQHLSQVLAFVKQEPDLNLFFIADLEFYGISTDFMTVWIDDPDQLGVVVLQYHANLLVYSPKLTFNPQEIIDLVVERKIRCLSCGEAVYLYLMPYLPNSTKVHHDIFAKLTNLITPTFDLTPARVATGEDALAIMTSQHQIAEFRDLMGNDLTLNASNCKQRINEGFTRHYIIAEDDIVVANANTSAGCSVAAMIGGVYTLPQYRGRGYATSVVYHLCYDLLQNNITPLLFFENPKAATIYHALGFEDFGHWYMCTFTI